MSSWWDEDSKRYRHSLPYKFFYIWTWPLTRWIIFHIPSEMAHKLGIRAIYIISVIDTIWSWLLVPFALAVIVPLALLLLCKLFDKETKR